MEDGIDIACKWMEMILSKSLKRPFITQLTSGRLLCKLVINICVALGLPDKAHAVIINEDDRVRNLHSFLSTCVILGLPEKECFQIEDLSLYTEFRMNTRETKLKDQRIIHTLLKLHAHVASLCETRGQDLSRLLPMVQENNAAAATRLLENSEEIIIISQTHIEMWKELLQEYQDLVDLSLNSMDDNIEDGGNEYAQYTSLSKIQSQLHQDIQHKKGTLPNDCHAKLWLLLSGAYMDIKKNPDYYQSLIISIESSDASVFESIYQIDADLSRTHVEEENEEYNAKLRRVLVAYSLHNPSIGYCQGMNYIAARLVSCMSEEEAFWMLIHLLACFPEDCYSTMYGVAVDHKAFTDFVSVFHPEIGAHLQHLGGTGQELSLVCTEWFLTLFASPFTVAVTYRIWDAIFTLGGEILFRVAIVLLGQHSTSLLKCTSYADALTLLNSIGRTSINPDTLMQLAFKQQGITKTRIEELRAFHRLALSISLSSETVKFLHSKRKKISKLAHKLRSTDTSSSTASELLTPSYAYYFDGIAPIVRRNHWTDKTVDVEWERISRCVVVQDDGQSWASTTNNPIPAEPPLHRSKSLRKFVLDWQREKKTKERLRKNEIVRRKQQQHIKKLQGAVQRPPIVPIPLPVFSEHSENACISPIVLRRNTSAPSMLELEQSGRSLLERSQVVSFLHRTAQDVNSESKEGFREDRVSFLTRLSLDLEKQLSIQDSDEEDNSDIEEKEDKITFWKNASMKFA